MENTVQVTIRNMPKIKYISIFLVEGEEAVLKTHSGLPDWFVERIRQISRSKNPIWNVITEGKPVYVTDIGKDTVIDPILKELGIKSYLSIPISSEGKTVGVININSLKKNAFNRVETNLLKTIAQQIEIAINNARYAETLRKAHNELEALIQERTAKLEEINKELQAEIAERKKAEEALEQISHQMELVLNSAGEGICGVDINGDISFLNPTVVRIFGLEANELIGKPRHMIVHHSRPDGTIYPWEECPVYLSLKDGATYYIYNEVFWRENGTSFSVEYITAPVREGDKIVGAVVTFNDITERKRIEEESLRLDKLESLGVLAGGIAHDFNNLLTGIMTTISSTKMDPHISAYAYENLIEAERACTQAKQLTQQLLTFSRGGTPIKKLTSIGQIIRESVSFALSGSNVKCNVSIEGGLWDAEVDREQIAQVITNLLINADQAMPQGGLIRVVADNVIKGAVDSEGSRYTRIIVEDYGIGIPKEHLPKIFDPYFMTKQRGSGLGLAVAYSIIRNHNGYIDVESELGRGTKFYIYIPASTRRAEEERIEQKKTPSGKGKILIMDDERIIRTAAGRALSRIGYEVECASDGAEAIRLYRKAKEINKPFDVVIIDLTVPGGIGGKEAIEKLISIDPEIKAIVSSGYSNDSVMSEFRRYGFRGVLPKPYTIEELTDTLRKVIEEK
ncbi:MAG: hypothetical protein C4291_01275 [Candidatus Dadabacteria bacterium]